MGKPDKTLADWQDVFKLRDLFILGKTKDEVVYQAAVLSHMKYTHNKGLASHEARKRYRTWLMRQALREAGKKK